MDCCFGAHMSAIVSNIQTDQLFGVVTTLGNNYYEDDSLNIDHVRLGYAGSPGDHAGRLKYYIMHDAQS